MLPFISCSLPPMSPRHLVSRQDNGGANSSCINPDPQNTVADRINLAFNSSGPGYIVRLCQGREYYIDSPIVLFANGQEISTEGYPIEQENGTDLRATLFVNGPVAGGQGHTTAIAGTWRSLLIGTTRCCFGTSSQLSPITVEIPLGIAHILLFFSLYFVSISAMQ